MINRNTIRIKIMQAIYEYDMLEHRKLSNAQNSLMRSFDDMYMLYFRILAMFGALTHTAEQVIERKKQKFLPTEADLCPNLKFINNIFIQKLDQNTSLRKHINENNLSWNNDVDLLFIRKIYDLLVNQDFFIEYMQSPDTSFEEDQKLVLSILEGFMLENETMINYFGEIKLNWLHDYNDVIILIHNTLKSFSKTQSDNKAFPSLFKPSKNDIWNDFNFANDLLRKTIQNDKIYSQLISEKMQNWEIGRLARIDFILLKMAICEFCEFPNIPLRVTFNEYIEISKYYGTPKSRNFVNGMLDEIQLHLKNENKINKQGRGLMG